MGGIAGDFAGERAGLVVPTEQDRAAAQAREQGSARDQRIRQRAPRVEQRTTTQTKAADEGEQARDRRIEFQHKRHAEISGQPESRALEDRVEALVAAQQQARVVESELGEAARDEQRDAHQQQPQVAPERRIGHVDADPADR